MEIEKDWFNDDEIYNSIDEKDRKRLVLEKYRPMVARLHRLGYFVLSFSPDVTFIEKEKMTDKEYDPSDVMRMNMKAWEFFDKTLAELEELRNKIGGM